MTEPTNDRSASASNLIDVDSLDPSIKLCVRYATPNNFLGRPFYDQARALLQLPVALSLVEVQRELKLNGQGLIVFDAYRPWSVTKLLWDLTPKDKRQFVADPEKGSIHNRGCAVDVSIYSIADGAEIPMPSGYDEMTERALPSYTGGSAEQRHNRDTLRQMMERHHFRVHPMEWWHFDHMTWPEYPIEDRSFAVIPHRRAESLRQASI
jgi:D-alanyl-D-alanine dipeptidase